MKIAIVNTFGKGGGAARAALRLHNALNMHPDIDVRFFSTDIQSGESRLKCNITDYDSAALEGDIQANYINTNRTNSSNTFFSFNAVQYDLVHKLRDFNPDVINLHWIAKFISNSTLDEILNIGKPVFWTLHDQRPLTGGCHYTANCDHFKNSMLCKSCFQLGSDPLFLPNKDLLERIKILSKKTLATVSPSNWLKKEADNSKIFQKMKNHVIPNTLDLETFTPHDKKQAKSCFGVAENSFCIMTGAQNNNEIRKGFPFFIEALKILKDRLPSKNIPKNLIEVLVIGESSDELRAAPFKVNSTGFIDNDELLAKCYSAADIFVLTSLEDNLPNAMIESMACGTPLIAFNTGGVCDFVKDFKTGRICSPRESFQLATAMLYAIENPSALRKWNETSRIMIEERCNPLTITNQYLKVFKFSE